MKPACNVATLIERFFTERLIRQRQAYSCPYGMANKESRLSENFEQMLEISFVCLPTDQIFWSSQ